MGPPRFDLPLRVRTAADAVVARRRLLAIARAIAPAEEIASRVAAGAAGVLDAALASGGHPEAHIVIRDENGSRNVEMLVRGVPRAALVPTLGEPDAPATVPLDLEGLRRITDRLELRDAGDGADVRLTLALPPGPPLDEVALRRALKEADDETDDDSPDELRRRNEELLHTLGELRRREAELVRLNASLVDTNRAVGVLYDELRTQEAIARELAERRARAVSTMAHEVRTPLYAAQGILEAIATERDGELDAQLNADLGLIGSSVEETLRMVNQQLELARDEASRDGLELTEVELAEVLSALRGLLSALPRRPLVTLAVHDPDEPLTLHTDAGKLAQILRNLVGNALKFTDEGDVIVRVVPEPGRVCFQVADTGIGMTPVELERAFEEFTQLAPHRPGTLPGTGLGLPLSKGLARQLGGSIEAESEPGVGSVFTLVLPRHAARHADGA